MLVDGAEQGSRASGGEPLNEDQRKHLEFIQAVIARLASSSTATKGWGLTVATAAFGFSATKAVPVVAGLGLVVVIFFGSSTRTTSARNDSSGTSTTTHGVARSGSTR